MVASIGGAESILQDENGNNAVLPTATRTGYTFTSWKDNAGNELTKDTIGQGKTFYAQWIDNIAPEMSVTTTSNASATQTATISATDSGSGVAGYYVGQTNPASGSVSYTTTNTGTINAPGTWYFSVKDNSGNVTTASKVFYRATLSGNGGTVTGSVASIIGEAGKSIALPTAARTGYTYKGWSTVSTATSGGTAWTANANTTLYASWLVNSYTLTFNANGGTCSETSRVVSYNNTYGDLPTPTRSGYTFLGWYTANVGGVQVSASTVMGTDNTTVYAQWRILPKTITVNGNISQYAIDCTGYTTITVTIDTNTSDHSGYYTAMLNVSPTTSTDQQIGYYWSAAAYNGSCSADIRDYGIVYVWASIGTSGSTGIPECITTITLQ